MCCLGRLVRASPDQDFNTSAMRVLILAKRFPPLCCGVGDYACRMAETLVESGELVVVLTEPADTPRHMAIGVREHTLGGWSDLRAVTEQIVGAGPDFVQLEYSGYAWGRWGVAWWLNALLFSLRGRGIPVRIGLHETAIRMRQHPLQIPVALAQWVHIGLMIAAAETVSLNMPSRVETLGRVFPWWRAKLRYRPNSSNIPVEPMSREERTRFRMERGVRDGQPVVATLGMFHSAKRYEELVSAIVRIRDARTNLWMLGDVGMAAPGYVDDLKAIAHAAGVEGRVWWPGRLEAGNLSRALQAADVFVLPQPDGHLTRSGSFMAAAAHGLPVVAVRDPDGRDQVEFTHGKNVWLVAQSTPEELANGVDALLKDARLTLELGNNLRQLYEERFDWRVTVGRFQAGGTASAVADAPNQGPATFATGPGGGVSTPAGKARITAAHAGGTKP